MFLLTRFAARFHATHATSQAQPIHSLAVIGGGAGLGYLLNALKTTYHSLNQPLKVTVFEPQSLGTGHAFHPRTPKDFTTNTAGSEIKDFEHYWGSKIPVDVRKVWDIHEKMPRAFVGEFLQANLNQLLENPSPLHVVHVPKKVVDLYAPQNQSVRRILHLTTQDGEKYTADAFIVASGQIGTHKQLPGIAPARVVNSIYPFIDNVSPLTIALKPLLATTEKLKIMIIGSGPSGIETSQYLLNHYESRMHITLVGHLNDIPAEIVFRENVTVLSRETFASIHDDKKYAGMDLVVNAMGMSPDPRGGFMESIMPHDFKLLRGTVSMKTKDFQPIVRETTAGVFCVTNAYLYGAAADGSQTRLAYFSDMARELSERIAKGIPPVKITTAENSTPFSLLSMSSMSHFSENYFLEPLSGTPDQQQFKMLKGFTANRLLLALLHPQQVPPAICGQDSQTQQLYLLHKRIDKSYLAKTVEELLGLTDPKLTGHLRQLFALNEQGNTIIPLKNNQHIRVTQRIRTKLALSLLNNVEKVGESQIHMTLFPYDAIKGNLPTSLIENDNPPLNVAMPSLHGTIGNNLLEYKRQTRHASDIALERAFRNTEDPSSLALSLAHIKELSYTQSKRRILVRMSAYQEMSSHKFINDSADIFSFFINEMNNTHKDEARFVAANFYDQVDICSRILTILRLREWLLSTKIESMPLYLKQYHQLCQKNNIKMGESFQALFQDESLWKGDSTENPYLNRKIQTNAFTIFKELEQSQNCNHHHIRNLRTDIAALPEDKQNSPLYHLSNIMYDYLKTNECIIAAKEKNNLNTLEYNEVRPQI